MTKYYRSGPGGSYLFPAPIYFTEVAILTLYPSPAGVGRLAGACCAGGWSGAGLGGEIRIFVLYDNRWGRAARGPGARK